MVKLYELEETYLKIRNLINNDDDELLNDTLDSINFSEDINNKLVGYGKITLDVKSDIETIKAEEKRLADRRKRLENKVANLEGRMLDAMELTDIKTIDDPLLTIKLRKNKRVSVINAEQLDNKYLVAQAPKISKIDIRNDLKAGVAVAGAELTEYTSLNIKWCLN